MKRRFTIHSAFLEFDFLISRNEILDIKKSNPWYQEIDFLISRNQIHFLISRNGILDKLISFFDIKNYISWYQGMNSWYEKIEFLISRNIFWGNVLLFIEYLFISRIWLLDIKKVIFNTKNKKIFLMSRNWILHIKKCIFMYFLISGNEFFYIKKSNSWYQ